jgi:hypothetical protein
MADFMKRQRGRNRKPGGGHHGGHHGGGGHHNPNRPMESNGPENTKVRGPVSLIYERYLQYSRDAASSGDRVLSENYAQYADHYFRLMRAMQPAPPPQQDRFNGDGEFEGGGEEGAAENEAAAAGGDNEGQRETGDEQPEADFPQGGQQHNFDRGDGDFRRGRRRGRGRNRYRSDGERSEGEMRGEGGEDRGSNDDGGERFEQRGEERAERSERPRREREDQNGPEGFSSGPKPAFLRDS